VRAALAGGGGSPVYLEALIAFYERRFADASRLARAAFAESPTFYEAGMLEARAQHQAARELMAANRTAEATAGFARAVQIYERVLDIARSDGDAWLGYGTMLYAQAVALTPGELPADLRQKAIGALHAARQINPDRPEPLFLEAEIYQHDANIAIIEYRDPSQPIATALALANAARDLGGDADEVDLFTCILHWERASYQSSHGVDPRPVLDQAVAACERALATKPHADRHATLGIVYDSLAAYEGAHGADPMGHFELADRNMRMAIEIEESANLQYSVGRMWTRVANYQAHHGQDPDRAVDTALAALQAAVRMDARRADAWAAMSDALIARIRFHHAERRPAHDAVTRAHAAIERALAIEPELLSAIKYRILLEELDAEWRLSHGGDPTQAVVRMRAHAQHWLRRVPDDGFGHGAACRADLLAARWGLRRSQRVDRELARAAAAAARARAIDAKDAQAWTASAEVDARRRAPADPQRTAPCAARWTASRPPSRSTRSYRGPRGCATSSLAKNWLILTSEGAGAADRQCFMAYYWVFHWQFSRRVQSTAASRLPNRR
jgi:eukaryotic-like serine/threonine-protein kinase